MKAPFLTFLFLVFAFSCQSPKNENREPNKPRTIVTTDGEIDDIDSFIRLLLYANEFHIEGLIYSSSMWHYKGDGKGTTFISEMEMTKNMYGEQTDLRWPGETWMEDLIAAYEKVFPNLIKHAATYPAPDYLRSLIRVGNIDFEGEMEKDTEGSDYIKKKLLDDTEEPIYLQVWGGTNTIARALKSIEEEFKGSDKWEGIYKKVCDKAIIYTILDQDATYRKYISKNWQDISIYYNANQFWCFAYPWKSAVPKAWHRYLEGEFMGQNIILNHGDLTQMYYSYGDGKKQEGDDEHIHGDSTQLKNAQWGSFKKFDFISEGDSPAFFHLIDTGLDNLDNPHYGGWGGRLVQSEQDPNRWEDGKGASDYNPFTDTLDTTYPQTRWVKTLQNDFAARADWCIKDYENANHPPQVLLEQKTLTAKAGEKIELMAKANDPDGDELKYQWWQYEEVDTYDGKVNLNVSNQIGLTFTMPNDIQKGETIHLILEVTDSGSYPMTRYQRAIITCL
ncbi:MAG: DUF1593 domain-containing protein [Bacteroidia bacterium]|nr:DUF1593 domain-containing protein [Bacteroidia bacterium]